jgi:hypothetical protein
LIEPGVKEGAKLVLDGRNIQVHGYDDGNQVTSADILARATIWAGETAAAQDEIFNSLTLQTETLFAGNTCGRA